MKFLKIILALISCLLCLGAVIWHETRPHDLEIYFFDIGQGDSILIRTPKNQDILIDGGPDDKAVSRLGRTLPFWDRDIELLILTHAHDDHVGGLPDVIKKYEIDRILYDDVFYENPNYDEFKRLIAEKGIPAEPTYCGDAFYFDTGVKLETLFPFIGSDLGSFEDLNDTSIVNRLVYGDIEVMLTGDATKVVEDLLLESGVDVRADILKVGHHGSKYSSSLPWIEAVAPETAVIQCGTGNKFGHPHFITLHNLGNQGIDIYRNDKQGTIKVETDGESAIISTMK